MTILIVEDNPGMRRLLRSVIADVADEVWECYDGSDALDGYETHRPDVVLMDLRMPRMDGLAATRQIRRSHPEAKIVIVTDYDDDTLRQAARDAGARAYVIKLDLRELALLIHSLVDQ